MKRHLSLLAFFAVAILSHAAVQTTSSTGSSPPTALETTKPGTAVTWMICVNGLYPGNGEHSGVSEEPFLSEVRLFAADSPYMTNNSGNIWKPCEGQSLPVNQNQSLFSLIGYTYGGSGANFNLPDLRGRTPIGVGQGTGLLNRTIAQSNDVVLTAANLPAHTHTITGGTTQPTGGVAENMPPFLVFSPWIADGPFFTDMGEIRWMAQDFAIPGYRCNGQLLPTNTNPNLFAKLGTTYGGNGTSNFALPDLRGRMAVGTGPGFTLGQTGGTDTYTLSTAEMPAHTHTHPLGGTTGSTGGAGAAHTQVAPYLVLNASLSPYGIFGGSLDTPAVGEVRFFAQTASLLASDAQTSGFVQPCDGSVHDVNLDEAFNTYIFIAGSIFGGDGFSTVGVPDLRGRAAYHQGQARFRSNNAIISGLSARNLGSSFGNNTFPALTTANLPAHTHDVPPPTLTTPTSASVSTSSATLGGNLTSDNGTVVTARGVVLAPTATNSNPQIGGTGVVNIAGTGTTGVFTVSAVSLSPGTAYSYAAYGTNFNGTGYSSVGTFTTTAGSTSTTISSLNITNTSPSNAATVNWTLTFASATTGVTAGNFALAGTATSGASIGTPTTSNSGLTWNIPVTTGSGSGTLGLNLANATGLSQSVSTTLPFTGQTYTMDKVTSAPTLTLPVSSTSVGSPMSISYSLPEAATNGSVKLVFVGSSTVTVTLTNANGTAGAHSFTLDLNNLVPGTNVASSTATSVPNGTYTVALQYQDSLGNAAAQASSTNVLVDAITQSPTLTAPASNGTSGNPISVNYTLPEQALSGSVKLAFVGASTITVTLTNANGTSGSHGFTLDPTNISGSPNVSATTSSTIPNGTYTVGLTYQDALGNAAASAVATNFTVNVAVAPSISTPTTASVTSSSATLGGNVTSDGGSAITERGVVYSPTATNSDPVIGGSGVIKATASGTTGVFTASPAGLSVATGYSFKAYATNIVGTTYTSVGTFTTLSNNANLSALTLNSGTLSPSFSANTTSYKAIVLKPTVNLVVTPTAGESHATVQVRVNGGSYSSVISGAASGNLALNLGSNTVDVLVTAQDTSFTKTYSLNVTRWTHLEAWRNTHFHDPANSGNGADNATPQNDGVPNLLKFATGLNPTANTPQPGSIGLNGSTLEFTYPRSVDAMSEITFIVEWSDTLDSGSWSAAGVTESVLSNNGTLQQVKASVDVSTQPRRFMRLRVTNP